MQESLTARGVVKVQEMISKRNRILPYFLPEVLPHTTHHKQTARRLKRRNNNNKSYYIGYHVKNRYMKYLYLDAYWLRHSSSSYKLQIIQIRKMERSRSICMICEKPALYFTLASQLYPPYVGRLYNGMNCILKNSIE